MLRWRDGLTGLFGAWFVISPAVFALAPHTWMTWSDLIVGLALFGLGVYGSFGGRRQASLSWIGAVLGAWLAVSPWLMGLKGGVVPVSLIVGAASVAAQIWEGVASRPTSDAAAPRAA